MPTIESMIRSINRQLVQYEKRLGTESEEWEYLTTKLYDLLGRPLHNDRDIPYYSRSKGRQYDEEALKQAYKEVTGKNTAAQLEQRYLSELYDLMGTEYATRENVKKYAKVRNKAFRYYSELYTYLKEAYEEEYGEGSWDNSELRAEYYRRGASGTLPEDTAFWLDEEITNLQGGSFLNGIERALNDLDAFNDYKKQKSAERAKGTRSSGKRNPKEFGSGMF